MLMIEKRDDVATLRALGADTKLIRSIFVGEGLLIGGLGASIGAVLARRLLPGTATFRNDSHPGRYVVVIQLSRRDALERFADRCGGFRGGNSGDFGADRAECDEKQQTMI